MGKIEEGSIRDIKFREDTQMNSLDDNQQEQVNSEDGLEFRCEKCFRVSKGTSNRVPLSWSKLVNRKGTGIFSK